MVRRIVSWRIPGNRLEVSTNGVPSGFCDFLEQREACSLTASRSSDRTLVASVVTPLESNHILTVCRAGVS